MEMMGRTCRRLALAVLLLALLLPQPSPAKEGKSSQVAKKTAKAGRRGRSYWAAISKKKKIVVAVNIDFPPFAMKDRRGGFFGYDVDLARMLGRSLDVAVEIATPKWKDMIPGLVEGKYDFVIAAMTRTPERARRIYFSTPYFHASTAALVEKRLIADSLREAELVTDDARGYLDLARMPGLAVGVKEGTTNEKRVKENLKGAKVRLYPSAAKAADALVKGEVSAVVHDSPFVRAWLLLNPGQAYRIAGLYQSPNRDGFSIATRRGDLDFLNWLNLFVEYLHDDGALASLEDRYFRRGGWVKRMAR